MESPVLHRLGWTAANSRISIQKILASGDGKTQEATSLLKMFIGRKALGSLSDVEIAEAMKAKVDEKMPVMLFLAAARATVSRKIALGIDEKGEIKGIPYRLFQ